GDDDSVFSQATCQFHGFDAVHTQKHHVGLRRLDELDAGQLREPFGESPGTNVVLVKTGDVVLERMQTGRGEYARLAHAAACDLAPAMRALDDLCAAGGHRADGCTQVLGKTDGNTVEMTSDV